MKIKTPLPPIILSTVFLLASVAIFQGSTNNSASAFLPSPTITGASRRSNPIHRRRPASPIAPTSPSSSSGPVVAPCATCLRSFFGLGPAELVIIAVAGLVVIGPSKLLQFSKEAGEVAGKTTSGLGDEWAELKAIPEEFQKGVEEGEIEARSRKAKDMGEVGED